MTAELEVHTGGALAISGEQTMWTDQQLAVLRSVGVNEQVTVPELTAFLHESQRTGLDPFTRQIYLIGRWDGQARRTVFRSQTGIDGYRVVAHRAARRDRVKLGYAPTQWCGEDGRWVDVWLKRDAPAAARVTVFRDGEAFPAVATLSEYMPTTKNGDPMPMWRRMPATMLGKCAEALALRKAFPHDLAGIYTAEEMEQADARQPEPQQRYTPQDAADAVARKAAGEQMVDIAPRGQVNPFDPAFELPASLGTASARPATDAQLARLAILVGEKRGVAGGSKQVKARRLVILGEMVGREIGTGRDLTLREASELIERLSLEPNHIADAEVVEETADDTVMDPDKVEADLLAAIQGAGDAQELADAYGRAEQAAKAGAIGTAALEPLKVARQRRQDELSADSGWSHQAMQRELGVSV